MFGYRSILIILGITWIAISVGGCQNQAQTGAALGALVGAGMGQAIGRDTEATLIGATIGGGAGYLIGNEADKQQAMADRRALREDSQYVSVNITNSNGSISQVRLRRHGPGYVGTRGEYYSQLPHEDQLRPIYGF